MNRILFRLACPLVMLFASLQSESIAADRLTIEPGPNPANGKHVVLISGDEEYRSEEAMPMLAKILSKKHGFKCTVLFSFGPNGAEYIDSNHSAGLRGLDALQSADLMIIGTRFRQPTEDQAKYITDFLNAGKPVIGVRTATHAFNGKGSFGGISFGEFGLKVLGEQWVSHHGGHKTQGARGVIEKDNAQHPILNQVSDVFAPSDVYGVIHLTDADKILMRGAVTETLDPASKPIAGSKNDPMQPFVWLHTYQRPNGAGTGQSLCTTAGAAVDFVSEDLRRLIVNASYFLTGQEVPVRADVAYVDPFYPSFYGFIRDADYWKNANLKPEDFGLGKSPAMPDPAGSPAWPHRPTPPQAGEKPLGKLELEKGQRIALMGNSTAERMNLHGYFEALLHTRYPDKQLVVRNFGWPADEVGNQQRPDNYTKIDDPLEIFSPDLFICFFGANESYAGTDAASVTRFVDTYKAWIADKVKKFTKDGKSPRFVIVGPLAFEATGNPLQPSGKVENENLAVYSKAVKDFAAQAGYPFVELYSETLKLFSAQPGAQYTINGLHMNEAGYREVGPMIDRQLFHGEHPTGVDVSQFAKVRKAVDDKSWYHLQDYRMLNGWYVYGGRRTWDTETFPLEFRKIRNMVAVRDQYIWDMVAGKDVPDQPDDTKTGELFTPETMFGTRDGGFRQGREPKTLEYPTPEESIAQMKVPEGFKVELVASEREFPEFSNPTQINFDNKGRLWVSCMINYPQWLPGSAKPGDKLFIFEDTNGDGKADKCKTFYDKLICPTGFEFWNGGVLVVDEPRILFLKDTDGDDVADEVTQLIDGIATDDTHHTMGAWEFSHGGLLYMLEGVAMSTAMETPWGPFRNRGSSGAYVLDPLALKFRHFKTPGYGNPWCMTFDQWGNGIIGDGTNAQQHWTSPLSGYEVPSRRTLTPVFDNQGMRPAVGNEFLVSRHLPDEMQGQFIYACVINMHGMPRFTVGDEPNTAGFSGKRIEDLLSSTDNFFRPVDPQIGPDGAIWFGDWCNALIGHMQYSQRDPNRDHEHGRMYRMVYTGKKLLEPITQAGKPIPELLDQLKTYEPRVRYRARRELRDRNKEEVLAAVNKWIDGCNDPLQLCEAMWIQEGFRQVDPALLKRIMASDSFNARAAAVHTFSNELERQANPEDFYLAAVGDEHPRVRLEAVRGLSFVQTPRALEVALMVTAKPLDYWLEYTLEHTLQALEPAAKSAQDAGNFLANAPEAVKKYYQDYKTATGPGGAVVKPLKIAEDTDASDKDRSKAVKDLAGLRGGNAKNGRLVFQRVCGACHKVGDEGKDFGPNLSDVGVRFPKEELIRSILMPNEKIAKGYETVMILDVNGVANNGFVLKENADSITLGIANGKTVEINKEDIELRKEMKASSMPEGLAKTIAPIEFLDLLEFLKEQNTLPKIVREGGWIETARPDEGKLRQHKGFNEISRNAAIKIKDDFPSIWNQSPHLLLSAIDPGDRDFVLHGPDGGQSKSPEVQIRLAQDSEVRHVWIENRQRPEFHDRAKGLTLSISMDGEKWEKVWQMEKPEASWGVDLPEGTRARYLKLSQPDGGILHLNRVVVYGK